MKVKSFSYTSLEKMDAEINQFLSDNSDKIKYKDLKYTAVYEEAYARIVHTAILIFEVDGSKSAYFE